MSLEERKQDFLRKAKEKHGDKYDYNEIIYKDMSRSKVKIKCTIHNEYVQTTPSSHLITIGGGCKKCRTINSSNYHKDKKELLCKTKEDKQENDVNNNVCSFIKEYGIKCKKNIEGNGLLCKEHIEIKNKSKSNVIKQKCAYKPLDNDFFVCTFKQNPDCTPYCGKHSRLGKINDDKKSGIRRCFNAIRGCDNILDKTYKFNSCEDCLKKDREYDKKLRDSKIETHNKLMEEGKNYIPCVECGKEKNSSSFISAYGLPTINCRECIDKHKIYDKKNYKSVHVDTDVVNDIIKASVPDKDTLIVQNTSLDTDNINDNSKNISSRVKNYRSSLIKQPFKKYIANNDKYSFKWRKINNDKSKEYQNYFGYIINQPIDDSNINNVKSDEEIMKTSVFLSRRYRMNIFKKDPKKYLEKIDKNNKKRLSKDYDEIISRTINYAKLLRTKISSYKTSAQKRGIEFNLKEEQLVKMFESPCWYCGDMPEDIGYLNGIDRIDSTGPYDESNTRACCSQCNMSKGSLSVDNFISQAYRIASFTGEIPTISCLFEDNIYKSASGVSTLNQVQYSAKNRGYECLLTNEQFDILKQQNCYLCGNKPENGCGIDRVDNNIGYVFENCKSCCNACNMMKRDEDVDDFIERCLRITKKFNNFDTEDMKAYCNGNNNRLMKRTTTGGLLSKREKSFIIWNERSKLDDWDLISSRVFFDSGSEEDIKKIAELNEKIKLELDRYLKLKIKNQKIKKETSKKIRETHIHNNQSKHSNKNVNKYNDNIKRERTLHTERNQSGIHNRNNKYDRKKDKDINKSNNNMNNSTKNTIPKFVIYQRKQRRLKAKYLKKSSLLKSLVMAIKDLKNNK